MSNPNKPSSGEREKPRSPIDVVKSIPKSERRAYVESLSPEERAQLRQELKEFKAAEAARRQAPNSASAPSGARPAASTERLTVLHEGQGAKPAKPRLTGEIANHPLFKKLGAAALAIALATGLGAGVATYAKNADPRPGTTLTDVNPDELDSYGEQAETLGIKDGYGEKGMWESNEKTSPYAFANAREVAEVCDNDEVEMIKYAAHNQVESFADYFANLPERLQPKLFQGKTILETEAVLESLSNEEYSQVEKTFQDIMDSAFTRRVILNGTYDNAYMRKKDPSGPSTHENMELVCSTTDESGLEATEFFWTDESGNEIGSIIVKMTPVYDKTGNIVGYEQCMQCVNKKDSGKYAGLDTIDDASVHTNTNDNSGSEGTGSEGTGSEGTGSEGTGSEGTGSEGTGSEGTGSEGTGSEGTGSEGTGSEGTGSEGTGSEGTGTETTLERKDTKKIDERSSLRDDWQELNTDVTPKTTLEKDQTNFEAIERQKREDANAANKAEQVRQQQAAAEAEAARQAAARRQAEAAAAAARSAEAAAKEAERAAAADKAAAKAIEDAVAAQRVAAEAERAAAAEQAARAASQARSNAEASANSSASTADRSATSTDRANMFESGDY